MGRLPGGGITGLGEGLKLWESQGKGLSFSCKEVSPRLGTARGQGSWEAELHGKDSLQDGGLGLLHVSVMLSRSLGCGHRPSR